MKNFIWWNRQLRFSAILQYPFILRNGIRKGKLYWKYLSIRVKKSHILPAMKMGSGLPISELMMKMFLLIKFSWQSGKKRTVVRVYISPILMMKNSLLIICRKMKVLPFQDSYAALIFPEKKLKKY